MTHEESVTVKEHLTALMSADSRLAAERDVRYNERFQHLLDIDAAERVVLETHLSALIKQQDRFMTRADVMLIVIVIGLLLQFASWMVHR